ncbi:MAG: transcriptional regulator family [Clostridia bacterium]|jgi:putative transcriptional regulator|nr:transcriptional regulator family [Clostridia bacterium]
MKINEVIRKYRKEANFTQEQIANYLGVTAPAVNKWENGNSYPDITLLAPLARVLKINMDTLLSFNEELTDMEINQLLSELSCKVQREGFEKAYEKGESLIKEHANCDKLILLIAQILNAFLTINNVGDSEKYETKIIQWYDLIITSDDKEVATMATASLVSKYMEKKEFEKAQQLLERIPPLGYDKQIIQAMLFSNQNKNDEAYEIYEKMLLKNANEICNVTQCIIRLLAKEKDHVKAERYVDISKKVAMLFDLGAYNEKTSELFLAIEKHDIKRSLDTLEEMVARIDTTSDFTKSDLYSHMKFKEVSDLQIISNMIKKGLESDKGLDFLREEPRFKAMLNAKSPKL